MKESNVFELTRSMEDYLKAIYMIECRLGYARCVNISSELAVSKTSVAKAIRTFQDMGYIKVVHHFITLSECGRQHAQAIYRRHCILESFKANWGCA